MKPEIEVLVYSPCYDHKEAPRVWRVLGAVPGILEQRPLPPKDAAYWPVSIERVSVFGEELTVWWIDEIALQAFSWAFDRACNELGDCRPVFHKLADELTDDELPF